MQLKISTGRSKKELKWKNKEISWEDLLSKLSKTYRTRETVAEYKKMKVTQQGDIKDIGGFVGGWLENGRRKSDSVICRSLITLDADTASKDFWDDLVAFNDYACCIYSTHKHTPEAPRLRLVIPLARTVDSEEYEAIARMVANDLGIDQFDDTTYQASRLMYWPSTSSDGVFLFEKQDGKWLDPDEVLKRYPDWHDVSFWPQSSRISEIHIAQAKKQGDPLDKEGLIGAFCRTYDIHTAIEKFLFDVYVACNQPNRYTYIKGTTAAGLVTYEDKWAYSNHGTDPASGKLCNAFDLVRIHKFAELDESAKPDTPSNRLPSFIAMQEFAAADDETKKTRLSEQLAAIDFDFNEEDSEEPTDTTAKKDELDWMSDLSLDKKGNVEPTTNNILIILHNDKNLKNLGKFNLFSMRHEVFGRLPWYKEKVKRNWRDEDDSGLRLYIEKIYGISAVNKVSDAMSIYSRDMEYHPVRDYLDSLEWDGIERLDTVLIDYLGAEDSRYVRLVTRKLMIGAVARIYRPGCKMDNTLILVGPQGYGKSTFIQKLAKSAVWFSDSLYVYSGKEAMEAVRGKWIIELAELAGMKKAEIETIKSFISGEKDSFRAAFKRHSEDNPRQCVFIGSTNEQEFLRDQTGNRRFWPVDIAVNERNKSVFVNLDDEVDQLWAEAKAAFIAGEPWHADYELTNLAVEVQQAHTESNELSTIISNYLNKELPAEWDDMSMEDRILFFEGYSEHKPGGYYRDRVCTLEIWQECMLGKAKDFNRQRQMEINNAMKGLKGWESKAFIRFKAGYGGARGFVRKAPYDPDFD